MGDPMCSWCWGIVPHLKKFKAEVERKGAGFSIIVGGLRPGGGDDWNQEMKNFLRHHWEEVNKRSGQPFGYELFEKDDFNYDTEPACRAVVIARNFLGERLIDFFESIQKKFYMDSEDPSQEGFYHSICQQFGIPFDRFTELFTSDKARQDTYQEFSLNRQWGVRGFPTVLLRSGRELHLITNGYADYSTMEERLEMIKNHLEKAK